MTTKARWKPLRRAHMVRKLTDADVEEASRITGTNYEEAREALQNELDACEYWINDLYQVAKRELRNAAGEVSAYHLNIRRRDGKPIFRDWRHFQWIKNQLVGDECEGLELYPAESRLNDTSNKYHLWVFADPTYRIPFGMQDRDIVEHDDAKKPGHRQRRM
jgi:hypothetical protein